MEVDVKLTVDRKSLTDIQKAIVDGFRKGAATGGGGGISGGSAALAGGVAGVAAGVVTLIGGVITAAIGAVVNILKKIWETLKQSSPMLSAQLDIAKRAFTLFFKPFGDFLGIILKPMAILMMKMARNFIKAAAPTLTALREGEISPMEAFENIADIFQATVVTPMKESGIGNILKSIFGFVTDLGGALVTLDFDKAVNAVGQFGANVAKDIEDALKVAEPIVEAQAEIIDDYAEAIDNMITSDDINKVNQFGDATSTLIEYLQGLADLPVQFREGDLGFPVERGPTGGLMAPEGYPVAPWDIDEMGQFQNTQRTMTDFENAVYEAFPTDDPFREINIDAMVSNFGTDMDKITGSVTNASIDFENVSKMTGGEGGNTVVSYMESTRSSFQDAKNKSDAIPEAVDGILANIAAAGAAQVAAVEEAGAAASESLYAEGAAQGATG